MKTLFKIEYDEESETIMSSCDASNNAEYHGVAYSIAELLIRNMDMLEEMESYLYKRLEGEGPEVEELDMPDVNDILKNIDKKSNNNDNLKN